MCYDDGMQKGSPPHVGLFRHSGVGLFWHSAIGLVWHSDVGLFWHSDVGVPGHQCILEGGMVFLACRNEEVSCALRYAKRERSRRSLGLWAGYD